MPTSTIYRLSSLSLLIGSLLSAIGVVGQGIFPDFFSPAWLLASASVYIGLLLVLLGLPAIYAIHMKRAGTLGLIGFALFFIACVNFGGGGGITDLVLLPLLTKFNALTNPSLAFILFFLVGKSLLLIGSIVFGIAALRSSSLPKGSIILLFVGVVLFLAGGRIHLVPYLDYLGEVLFILSFAWFGSALLSSLRREEESQPTSASTRTTAHV